MPVPGGTQTQGWAFSRITLRTWAISWSTASPYTRPPCREGHPNLRCNGSCGTAGRVDSRHDSANTSDPIQEGYNSTDTRGNQSPHQSAALLDTLQYCKQHQPSLLCHDHFGVKSSPNHAESFFIVRGTTQNSCITTLAV